MDDSSQAGHADFSWVQVKDRFFALPGYKQLILGLVVLVVAAIALTLLQATLRGSFGGMMGTSESLMMSPQWGYDSVSSGVSAPSYTKSVDEMSRMAYDAPTTDTYPPALSGGIGVYHEADYDAIAYRAVIKRGTIDSVCETIVSWKAHRDIVFEYAFEDERACEYRFKVAHALHQSTLEKIEHFSPETLSVTTDTTKKQMVQYSGEMAILLQKQSMLETTLRDATLAFEELMATARSTGDVDALSKTIDKKLTHLKQLSDERISLAGQIQRMERNMAELQDRVDFVHFNVRVDRYEVIDRTAIKDSWVYAMKRFVTDLNLTLQSMTLGLALGLLTLAQVLVYLVILLVLVKYGYRSVRVFWRK